MQGINPQCKTGEPISDRELLRRFSLDSDEAAFAEIVRRYERLVMSVCRRVIGSGQEADDAFQATFITLARKPKQIRKIGSLSSWLYSVAWRISVRLVRTRRKNPVQPLPEDHAVCATDPLKQIAADQHAVILDEELQSLPDKYRDVLVMTYFAEQTSQEIASQLDVSKGTVDGRIRQARNMLRVKLARRGVGIGVLLAAATLMKTEAASASPTLVSGTIEIGTQTFSQSLSGTTDLSHLEPLVRPEISSMIGTKLLLSAVVGVCAIAGLAGMGTGQNEQATSGAPQPAVVDSRDVGTSEVASERPNPSEPIAVSLSQTETPRVVDATAANATRPVAKPFAFYPEDARPTEKWLYETLDKPIPPIRHSEGTPLAAILEGLAAHYSKSSDGQPIQFWPDRAALEDAALGKLDELLLDRDIELSGMSLQSALHLVFGSIDNVDEELTVIVRDEILTVTTRAEAEAPENYYIRTYDVASLLSLDVGVPTPTAPTGGGGSGGGLFSVPGGAQMGGGPRGMPQVQGIVGVVMQMTSPPALWVDMGEDGGSIALVGTKLVVRQNAVAHREIAKLLNLLVETN